MTKKTIPTYTMRLILIYCRTHKYARLHFLESQIYLILPLKLKTYLFSPLESINDVTPTLNTTTVPLLQIKDKKFYTCKYSSTVSKTTAAKEMNVIPQQLSSILSGR